MDLGSLPDLAITTQMVRDSLPPYRTIAHSFAGSIQTTNTFLALQGQAHYTTSTLREIDDLIHLRNVDFFSAYRTAVLRHQDDITARYDLVHMSNGIIASPSHRYALAKDYLTKDFNTFWARRSENLGSEISLITGDREFVDHEFRYHWGTYNQHTPLSDITKSIEAHVSGIAHFGHKKMTGYGGDLANIYRNKEHLKTYGYTNDGYGISVHEMPQDLGGEWVVKLSLNFEKNGGASSFVDIDNFDPNRDFLNAIVSNGVQFERYATKGEALANMIMLDNQRSQMVWGAEDPGSLSGFKAKSRIRGMASKTFTTCYSFIFKELKNPENKQEAFWDVFTTIAAAVAARTVALISLPVAVTIAIAMNFGNRKAMNFAFKGLAQKVDYIARGPKAIVGHEADYVASSIQNMLRRFNRKVNVKKDKDLIVTTGIDLTRHDTKRLSSRENQKVEKELCSHGSAAYPRLASQVDRNTSTDFSFNGIARLVRYDPETGNIETYVKYIDAFDINAKISVSEEVKNLLKNDQIIKLTQPKGQKRIYAQELTFDRMRSELKDGLCDNVQNPQDKRYARKAAFGHLNWLFNSASEKIEQDFSKPYVLTARQRLSHQKPMTHCETPASRLMDAQKAFRNSDISIELPTQELIVLCDSAIFPVQRFAIQ